MVWLEASGGRIFGTYPDLTLTVQPYPGNCATQAVYFNGPLATDIRHDVRLIASYQFRPWVSMGVQSFDVNLHGEGHLPKTPRRGDVRGIRLRASQGHEWLRACRYEPSPES